MHFYAWQSGLKLECIIYVRKKAADAIKFTTTTIKAEPIVQTAPKNNWKWLLTVEPVTNLQWVLKNIGQ
jgi:hypothetical protein